ncbi:MAG: tRNA (N6-threonylcarbamoyladenosine(37)-N6)-methyltransferase TrmO [Bdellovibrionota bacterium]
MNFEPIGIVRSPFQERFGIPRQAGLVSSRAVIELPDSAEMRDALRGLEAFSHIWVVFVFHDTLSESWNPLVRPPRLGGARKIGVFASRSPHRPNPIGISAVALEKIEGTRLFISGADLLDGTPVLDIKPYIPYADSIAGARADWAAEPPAARLQVELSAELQAAPPAPEFTALLLQVIALDPRPAFQAAETSGEFAMRLGGFDVHWRIEGERAIVTGLVPLDPDSSSG